LAHLALDPTPDRQVTHFGDRDLIAELQARRQEEVARAPPKLAGVGQANCDLASGDIPNGLGGADDLVHAHDRRRILLALEHLVATQRSGPRTVAKNTNGGSRRRQEFWRDGHAHSVSIRCGVTCQCGELLGILGRFGWWPPIDLLLAFRSVNSRGDAGFSASSSGDRNR
jgi:hypothetical protein